MANNGASALEGPNQVLDAKLPNLDGNMSRRDKHKHVELKCLACQSFKRSKYMKKDYWVQVCNTCFEKSQSLYKDMKMLK